MSNAVEATSLMSGCLLGRIALALVALAAWTYTAAVVKVTYYDGTNTDYTVNEIATFDQQFRDQLEYGSKLFFGSWYA